MSITKKDNQTTHNQGVAIPKNDKLTVARKGEIAYYGRGSFTLDLATPVYKMYIKVHHGLSGSLYTNVGAMSIVNAISKDADGISRIEPWNNSGIYYVYGSTQIHYRKQYFLTTDYLLITYTMRFVGTTGSAKLSSPSGYLQWQTLNTNTAYVSAEYDEIGSEGSSGFFMLYDVLAFDAEGNLVDSDFTGSHQYDTADWAYEPSGKWWRY